MGVKTRDRVLSLTGLVAAVAFAVVANGLALRHYRRWDVTSARTHSLSAATVSTLRSLDQPVQVIVLLSASEALRESIRHALESYRAETTQLSVDFVDPDKEPARFDDVRRRFRLEPGRAEAGRAVENVAIIVARGERHWFVERSDLIEVESVAEAKVKPREERALTSAIRAVLSGERTRVCFVSGHGEPPLDDFGPRGAGSLAEVLRKDNYDPTTVDPTAPNAADVYRGCTVVVIATARRPWTSAEASTLTRYLENGGTAFFALSPVATKEGFLAPGLASVLEPFGIGLVDALAVETEPELFFPESRGTQFIASVRAHPVTASLAAEGAGRMPPPVVLELARPLRRLEGSSAIPLLTTSDRAFGATGLTDETAWSTPPQQSSSDLPGPLTLAMANDRNSGPGAMKGRVVVVGTSSVLSTRGDPLAMGSAFFSEGAISWLASRAPVLDIPDRPAVTAGVRLTAESLSEVKRYVLVFIPLTFALLGGLVHWSRRRPTRTQRRVGYGPSR